MVLAPPAPKSNASLDEEGGLYLFLFIILFVAVLGMIFDPHQVAGILGQTIGSVLSPFTAILNGIVVFFEGLISGIISYVQGKITGGVTGIGGYIYHNTIGRL